MKWIRCYLESTVKLRLYLIWLFRRSRSNNDLLSIDKQSSDTASLHSLPINSAISGLDTPSGIDTPSSARSSQENNAAFPRNNSEPSVSISPLASPDFTSSCT